MTRDTLRRGVFRRTLEREAGPAPDPPAIAAACRRLCERLAQRLSPLIGDAGVDAIHGRSLHLAERQVTGFAPLPTTDPAEGSLVRLQLSLEHQEASVAMDAAVAVLATVSELLASFIGEGLTARLLRETWPDDFAGERAGETTT